MLRSYSPLNKKKKRQHCYCFLAVAAGDTMSVSKSHSCVFGCPIEHRSLHRLPSSEPLRTLWLKFIFQGNVPENVGKFLYVCTNHFTPDCLTNQGQFNAGFSQRLLLKEGSIPTIPARKSDKVSTHEDLARVHHVACQTDPPKLCTVATQLSITTLRPHFRSTGVQATMPCPDVDVGTSEPQLSSAPIKMPRLELKEEEEDQESHWVLQMIV
ncbi:hypothetical protein G5714_003014 [Onychostoma macrolepis]|uniref:THAP-type domain-containing protein n=1 Tax=Onychostoma macrolepis TaxID=369639 RepID=A0A7J6D916_9TELE|nr:hypothetical protein G5714_003014 [Onychostoma macrolepis]